MAIKKGDKIKVEYEGRFENGHVFDSSNRGGVQRPLEFEAGAGMVVKGFDEAVIGMEAGEEKEFTLKPEDAYGVRKDDLLQKISLENLPKEPAPKVGAILLMKTPDGHQMPVVVSKIEEDSVTLDMNHPLAGKTLIFKIKIV